MRRGYRILALALAVAALFVSGCVERDGSWQDIKAEQLSDPVTAESLTRVIGRRLWRQQSAEFSVQGSFDMVRDTGRGMSDMTLDMSFQGELITTDVQLHLDGSADMSLMGITMVFPMVLYVRQEPDALSVSVEAMDQWSRQTLPIPPDVLDGMLSRILDYSTDQEVLRHVILRDEEELVGDKKCYRLDYEIRGGELELPAAAGVSVEGWDELVYTMTCWVDTETVLPARLSVSVEGPVGTEEFLLRRGTVLVDFTGFGTVESIIIPPEAFNGTGESNGTDFPI